MNSYTMIDAMSYIDNDLIEKYLFLRKQFSIEKGKKFKERHIWLRLGSAIASFAIAVLISLWLFVPINNVTQAANFYSFPIDGLFAEYMEVTKLSRYERLSLKNNIGDLFYEKGDDKLYKLKNKNGVDLLIVSTASGDLQLMQFVKYYDINEATEITLEYIFNSVYDLNSIEQIEKVVFDKVESYTNGEVERNVIINKFNITDQAELERILSILSSLNYSPSIRIHTVLPYDKEYLNGETPISAQTVRKLTLLLNDGRYADFIFYPYERCVSLFGSMYGIISEDDCQYLIDLVGIDTEYHNWGIPGEVSNSTQAPKKYE